MKKRFSTLLGCLVLGTTFATTVNAAETRYVTENLSTFVRKGAGDNFKIAGAVQAGEKVTLIEQRERYSLIRDGKNREVWILNSELSTNPSSKELTPQLTQRVQELTTRLNNIDKEWQQRTQEMQRRAQQAEQQSSALIVQNAQLKRELEITKNKNRDLETMHDAEKREIVIQWFIYGGSVLAAGLILGLIIPVLLPRRRRNNGWS